MAQQRLVGQGLFIIEVSRSHRDTPHMVGLLGMSDRLIAVIYLRTHTKFATDRHQSPRWDSNSQHQQVSGHSSMSDRTATGIHIFTFRHKKLTIMRRFLITTVGQSMCFLWWTGVHTHTFHLTETAQLWQGMVPLMHSTRVRLVLFPPALKTLMLALCLPCMAVREVCPIWLHLETAHLWILCLLDCASSW